MLRRADPTHLYRALLYDILRQAQCQVDAKPLICYFKRVLPQALA